MNVIIYIAIFTIGIVFGSFFTLAVHRIPRKEDITHVRSYCPHCNHRLAFLDLIPLFSFLALGGKCRYCKEKIRIRYFLLEALSGISFILIALSRGVSYDMAIPNILELVLAYLLIAGVFIIAGIDKERLEIPNGLIFYELAIGILCTIIAGKEWISHIAGFLVIPLILLVVNLFIKKLKKDENKLPFGMGDIKYIAVIGLCLGFGMQVIALCISVLLIALHMIFSKALRESNEIAFGFYFSIAIVLVVIANPFLIDVVSCIEMMRII